MRLPFNKLAAKIAPLFLIAALISISTENAGIHASTDSATFTPLGDSEFKLILESGRGWQNITALTNSQALELSHYAGVSVSDDFINRITKPSKNKAGNKQQFTSSMFEELRGVREVLPLIALAELSDKQAEYLSRFKGHALLLWSLDYLDEAQAKSLGQFRGDWIYAELDLRGVTSLSVSKASSLAKFTGDKLNLGGIERISDEVAFAFEGSRCADLSLDGLTRLSLNQANALGGFSGAVLSLDGLPGVTTLQARALAGFTGEALSLRGIALTDDVALAELCVFGGRKLDMSGLRYISDEQAKSLAKFRGIELRLARLDDLSDVQAEELGKAQCQELYLDGLTWQSIAQTISLSRFSGSTLSFASLNQMDLRGLRFYGGENLYLTGLTELNRHRADAILALRVRMVWLDASRILSDEEFGLLRQSDSVGLHLPDVRSLKEVPLQLLMSWRGGLSLAGVSELDEFYMPALAAWDGSALQLNGVCELQTGQATALSEFNCASLSVSGLKALTDTDIDELLGFSGRALDANGWSRKSRLSYSQKQYSEKNNK